MPRRTNVLYVQPNSEIGGSDIALLRLVQSLDLDRYRPYVALPGEGPMVEKYRTSGAEVRFVPMRQLRTLPDPIYQARYVFEFWPTVRRLARLIEREEIGFVHTNSLFTPYGAWAARRTGRPHLWHIREIPPNVPVGRRLYAAMVRALSRRVLPMSGACVRGLFGSRGVSSKIDMIPDALDLSRWGESVSGERIRKEIGIPEDVPLVGFVARLDPWKGLNVFLEAARLISRSVPRARFLVSGGPPAGFEAYERRMRAMARRLGLQGKICFTGWRYGVDDIPELMRALTVFSHTSVRPEPFGLVLIEAMAASTPVVAAGAGGPMEIVADGETGYLTPPGDHHAHALAVTSILTERSRIERFGRAGRRRAEQMYASERFRRRLHRIYLDVERTL